MPWFICKIRYLMKLYLKWEYRNARWRDFGILYCHSMFKPTTGLLVWKNVHREKLGRKEPWNIAKVHNLPHQIWDIKHLLLCSVLAWHLVLPTSLLRKNCYFPTSFILFYYFRILIIAYLASTCVACSTA